MKLQMEIKINSTVEDIPLTYRIFTTTDGKKSAYFIDTGGHYLNLKNHTIALDGTVTPSVGCPICPFHEHIKLSGWNEVTCNE